MTPAVYHLPLLHPHMQNHPHPRQQSQCSLHLSLSRLSVSSDWEPF